MTANMGKLAWTSLLFVLILLGISGLLWIRWMDHTGTASFIPPAPQADAESFSTPPLELEQSAQLKRLPIAPNAKERLEGAANAAHSDTTFVEPAATFSSKYASLDLHQLQRARTEIGREQRNLARPLLHERDLGGQYRLEGPFPKDQPVDLDWLEDMPPMLRPQVRIGSVPAGENDHFVQIVEVFPHELPELEALREEQIWLDSRIQELRDLR